MSSAVINLISIILASISLLVAIAALVFSIIESRESRKLYRTEMELQNAMARAEVKPLLIVLTSEFENNKGVILSNAGVGLAIIHRIDFEKNNQKSNSLVDLIESDNQSIMWDNFWRFSSQKHYLAAGASIDLIRLTETNLIEQGFSHDSAQELLNDVQNQMSGIFITIDYEDVFGGKQPDDGRRL